MNGKYENRVDKSLYPCYTKVRCNEMYPKIKMKTKKNNLVKFKDFLNKKVSIRPILGRFFNFKNKKEKEVFHSNCKMCFNKVCVLIVVFVIFSGFCLPQHSLAYVFPELKSLPILENKEPMKIVELHVTAYNSLPWQTNDEPCITASGMNVCERGAEDIIATNYSYLPFGSKIKIPELFRDREFVVEDRMNKRYTQTLDIWMKNYFDAKEFGRQKIIAEIYPAAR